MNLWKKIKYGLWPAVKMKLKMWWYSLRYGGKENIPPEVIFGEMEDSMKRLQENLMNALRSVPEDISEEDKEKLVQAMQMANDLDSDMQKAGDEARDQFEEKQKEND